jgi:hypothetical protein
MMDDYLKESENLIDMSKYKKSRMRCTTTTYELCNPNCPFYLEQHRLIPKRMKNDFDKEINFIHRIIANRYNESDKKSVEGLGLYGIMRTLEELYKDKLL